MPDYGKLRAHVNGELVPLREARVSVFDSALMFGDMVFEMTRSFQRKPFRLEQHLDRLYASLRLVEIDCGLTREAMAEVTLATVAANLDCLEEDLDYFILHDISRGPLGYYTPVFADGMQPTVIIAVWPLTEHIARVADEYDTGVHAVIPSQRAIPSRYLDPKAKTRSRLHYEIANLQAARLGPEAWPVLLDEHGYIAEGTSCNFFMVKDGRLYTSEARNILRGISRGYIFELAEELGIPCEAANLEPYDALQADEAFFSASSFSILPITRFEGRTVGDGKPGAVTRRLLDEWGRRVGVDIVAQAKHVARRYCQTPV
jgi:branched-chain amino acid aminotransferase